MSASILQNTKECFLCRVEAEENGIYIQLPSGGLEKHHVMHGTANRKMSEKYGLTVYLCPKDHRTGKKAVHNCRETDLKLICIAQKKFEDIHGHDEWMRAFGKNYI
jgi:hypothetical protein